jgi:predicted metal-dependent peptidase
MTDSTQAEKPKVKTVTDPKIDTAAREKLVTARIGLLLRAPFFGNIATRMNLINADAWCGTAATDGRRFYYNSAFVNNLPLKQLEFLVGHEVLHAVYDHMGRRGNRDPKLWNIADDYCVNYDLVEQKVGDKIPVALYDAKFKGMAAEEVYDYLYQNANKIDINQLAKQLLDEHMDGSGDDGEGDGDEDGDGQQRSHAGGKPGEEEGDGRPKISKEEQKEIRDELREAILAAANAVGAGNLPGGVKRMIKDLTEPVMNWRDLLEQQIQSTIKSDFTWTRPSRRSWHMDAVMPGLKPGEQIDVCVAIDTSGSITEKDLKDFLSEVKGIMESYDEYKIHVITWDTEVHNPQIFTSENLEDIASYVPGGGGGTEPHCVWEWLQENEIEPKKLIMFTDFCFFGWRPNDVQDYCDTVWVIKGNRSAEPEFGLYAHYEDEKAGK